MNGDVPGTLNLYDGERFDAVAGCNVPPEFAATQLNKPFTPHPKSALGTVAATKFHIPMSSPMIPLAGRRPNSSEISCAQLA